MQEERLLETFEEHPDGGDFGESFPSPAVFETEIVPPSATTGEPASRVHIADSSPDIPNVGSFEAFGASVS